MVRYVLGVLFAIGLIILIIILLFSGGPSKVLPPPINLPDLATNGGQVQLVLKGQVEANSEHREIRMTVGSGMATLDIVRGYQNDVIKTYQHNNNNQAYTVFLKALNQAGFINGDNSKPGDGDGVCPLGEGHVYRVISGGGDVEKRMWGTSCGGGTFRGDANLVITLFQNQFPKYNDETADVNLP